MLGEWDVAAAPDMQWTEGHLWVADLAVPEDTDLEFKLVHITYGGAAWEPSQNRHVSVVMGCPLCRPCRARFHIVALLPADRDGCQGIDLHSP